MMARILLAFFCRIGSVPMILFSSFMESGIALHLSFDFS
jgi:hypothetical protein